MTERPLRRACRAVARHPRECSLRLIVVGRVPSDDQPGWRGCSRRACALLVAMAAQSAHGRAGRPCRAVARHPCGRSLCLIVTGRAPNDDQRGWRGCPWRACALLVGMAAKGAHGRAGRPRRAVARHPRGRLLCLIVVGRVPSDDQPGWRGCSRRACALLVAMAAKGAHGRAGRPGRTVPRHACGRSLCLIVVGRAPNDD